MLGSLKKSIFGFLRAQLILSAFTYVITLTGLLVLGVNYPLAIALLVTIVDILPILGVGSVLVPWAIYLLVVGDYFTGIGLILLFILITVIRRVLEPKVIGDAVGIGALPALISMYVGFKLVGVIGFFYRPVGHYLVFGNAQGRLIPDQNQVLITTKTLFFREPCGKMGFFLFPEFIFRADDIC
ncbi:AI-2E family transporter [Paenibacillus sp. DMB20]|uniref:AI-2E family transporter n=1 Tax=Paenibacillus sp. DMB20 TaxID=1642570 RepID=UPI000A43386B|nr:AI-2E family transporter [Paenibacillus sp. DMB20]